MELPPPRRYRIVTIDVEGHQDRGIGRRHVSFEGTTLLVHERRATGPVSASYEIIASMKPSRNSWELTTADGGTVRLSGCGCGS